MELPEIIVRFMYALPLSSLFIPVMSFVTFASLTHAGFMEMRGNNQLYAKFFNVGDPTTLNKPKLSGRIGMLLFYTPALLASVASFAIFPNQGFRFTLLLSALTIHFFKRDFEVLFIHKFSGGMDAEAAITISLSYFVSTTSMIYAQHLTQGIPEPQIDLKHAGMALCLVGISGNFYHHCILSRLRTKGNKQYKIPKGGLFNLVICPHYLFEILGFAGVACISQNLYAFSYALGTSFLLMGRSFATRKWYESKFEDFPKNTKAIIPFFF